MDVRVLGPVEASAGGRPLAIGAGKPRALLAMLALHAGSTVSTDRLVEGLWGEQPPVTAVKMVQLFVSQLRRTLATGRADAKIVTRGRGYELELGRDGVDALRFERLIADGAAREALELWRGPALADLADEPFAAAEIRRLDELRLTATELAIDADLAAGLHREVIGELDALVAREPLRERLHAQRMLALYRSGRQAEALAAYQQARATLVEQVGLEPGPELAGLHQAILAHDRALDLATPGSELPSGVVTFMLSDIEGSTRLWEAEPQAMPRALELHDELIARTVEANGGHLVKSKGEGDSTLSVFQRASDGVACAAGLPATLAAASWPDGLALRVRVAVHTGEAHERDGDYYGPALNRAARLRALARGGMTMISSATAEIVRDRLSDELELVDVGRRELQGLSRPERVFELRPRAVAPPPGATPVPRPLELPLPLQVANSVLLVGRDRELAELRDLWARRLRRSHIAIVAGEAGIGKTRLASELALAVHGHGDLVFYGRCDEGLAVPYQPWVQALRPAAQALGLERLRGELGPLAPSLSRLWPELEAVGVPASTDPETERYTLFDAVAALIEIATRTQRALLVLDDLHWAARPTLLLLRHLIRSERPLGALVVATCRDTELAADDALPQLVADLQRDAGATTVHVDGLDERAISALLEAAGGQRLDERAAEYVRMIRSQTGGNPFFIRELLAHLVESGAIYRRGERWTTDLTATELEVPEGLRHVIDQRVTRLSETAKRALALAAVAGQTFSLSLLEQVLGEQRDLLDGLDGAVSAGLLTEAGPGEYAFAHALVRQTIYEGHSATRRMRLHRRLGEALETRPDADAHVEALAHHFAQAAADGQGTKAATYALAAGRKATARLAYEDAAAHYEQGLRALDLAPAPPDELRGDLLLALAAARWSSGDMDDAREASRRAAELADRHGDPERLARSALVFAGPLRIELSAAVTEPTVGLLERALEVLGEGDSALRARAMGRLAAALANSAPDRRRPALGYRALEMARRVGDKRALADVLCTSHWATWSPDNLDERIATAGELVRVTSEAGSALEGLARTWKISNLLELGAMEGVDRELVAHHRFADTVRQRYARSIAAMTRAEKAHVEGRLEDYERLAREAHALGVAGQDESATYALGMQLSCVRRQQGRADELLDPIRGFVDRYPDVPAWRCALAWVYAELDRRRDARRELELLARHDFGDLPRDWLWLLSIALLSEVVAFLPDARRATRLYELLLPFADRCVVGVPVCLGSASRPLGLLATTMARLDPAARHFEDALEMNARIRSPLWVSHTQHDYARTLLRRARPGDRDRALELLGAALATAEKLGLKALTDRALPLMRQAEASAST